MTSSHRIAAFKRRIDLSEPLVCMQKASINAEWYMHEGEVFEPRAPRSNIACMHRPLEEGSICGPSLQNGDPMC